MPKYRVGYEVEIEGSPTPKEKVDPRSVKRHCLVVAADPDEAKLIVERRAKYDWCKHHVTWVKKVGMETRY